jgi:hypothetical protein
VLCYTLHCPAGGATQTHAHRHCCDIVLPSDEHDILNICSHASTPVAAAAIAASPLRASPTRCKQALTLIKRKQQQQHLNMSLNSSTTATKLSNEHHHSGYSGSTVAAAPVAVVAAAASAVPHAVSVDIAAAWLKSTIGITVKDPKSLLKGPAHEFRDGTLLGR